MPVYAYQGWTHLKDGAGTLSAESKVLLQIMVIYAPHSVCVDVQKFNTPKPSRKLFLWIDTV